MPGTNWTLDKCAMLYQRLAAEAVSCHHELVTLKLCSGRISQATDACHNFGSSVDVWCRGVLNESFCQPQSCVVKNLKKGSIFSHNKA